LALSLPPRAKDEDVVTGPVMKYREKVSDQGERGQPWCTVRNILPHFSKTASNAIIIDRGDEFENDIPLVWKR